MSGVFDVLEVWLQYFKSRNVNSELAEIECIIDDLGASIYSTDDLDPDSDDGVDDGDIKLENSASK
jgi:hypothetical protein